MQPAGAVQSAAMARYAASLAHEMNQPLASILTHADATLRWLDRPQPDIGEAVSALEHIRAAAQRAAGIVAALRALARQAPPDRTPWRLKAIVEDTLRLVAGELGACRITVVDRLAGEPDTVLVDPVQIRQVLVNLIANAVHAIGERANSDGRIVLETNHAGGAVRLAVTDNGCGMDDDLLAQIFQPFFTTKRSGMGVGLAICRSIVEAHGSRLDAVSTPGEGSTFSFSLALAADG